MGFGDDGLKTEKRIFIKLLNRELLLMPHAFERMVERGISLDELIEMLESPTSSAMMGRQGRIRVTDGKLTAILQLAGRELYLVTTYRNR